MKKRYQVHLEEENTEKARVILQNMGLSLSGYLRLHLADFVKVAENSGIAEKKPSEMTMAEFMQAVNHWIKAGDEA